MNLDHASVFHIFSFVFNNQSPSRTTQSTLAPFSVCRSWRETLCGIASVPFWQQTFHKRFPKFLVPRSPSKKRTVSALSHDYRVLFLQTSAILQVDSNWFNPKISQESDDQFLELPQDTSRFLRELMESLTLRLFSKKFTQFISSNCHHLLYGPAGCGKATLIESLARMWGAHLIAIQYDALFRISSRIEWSGFVDILCNYIHSFCEASSPAIIHIHNLSPMGNSMIQNAFAHLFGQLSVPNVWAIGTTTMSNCTVQLSDHLVAKLYIPFPTASERETYLKTLLLPSSLTSVIPTPRFSRMAILPSSMSPLSSPSPSPPGAEFMGPPPPVSAASVHLLALRTHDFTYTDLKALSDLLHEEFELTDKRGSLPFVKLMEVLSKVVPLYKPDDAKKFDSFDPSLLFANVAPIERRRSVPTVI